MSVYYVLAPELGMVKIGFAAEPRTRFSKIQSDSPVRLLLVRIEDGDEHTEAARHAEFASHRQRGEWFRYEGALLVHVEALPPIPERVAKKSLNAKLVNLGMSKSYASMVLSGKQRPALSLAVYIFRETGWRHQRIADLTEEQLNLLETIEPWSPSSVARRQAA